MTASPVTPTPPAAGSGAPGPGTPRWVWVLLILLVAVVVGGTAGLLSHVGGASIPNAVLTAGGAFGGTALLALAMAHFLAGDRR